MIVFLLTRRVIGHDLQESDVLSDLFIYWTLLWTYFDCRNRALRSVLVILDIWDTAEGSVRTHVSCITRVVR